MSQEDLINLLKQIYEYYSTYKMIIRCINCFILIFFNIIKGIPLYKLAKKNNIKNKWLSFFPIGDNYIIIMLSNAKYKIASNKITFFILYELIFIPVYIASIFFDFIPFEGKIWSIGCFIILTGLKFKIYYDFIKEYFKNKYIILLCSILSSIYPLVFVLVLYIIYFKQNKKNMNKL